YDRQGMQALAPTLNADRPFRFQTERSDQWYNLLNADQTSPPMIVRLTTSGEDLPPNLDGLKVGQVGVYVARAAGKAFEVTATMRFPAKGAQQTAGGSATSIDGVISTRRGNAGNWTSMIGGAPFGDWELSLPDSAETRGWFQKEEIEDILLDITYAG